MKLRMIALAFFAWLSIGANGCDPWALDDGTDKPPSVCQGGGGDGAGGDVGAGGDEGAGGAPDESMGAGAGSAGAGAGSSSADVSAGAGAGAGASPGARPAQGPPRHARPHRRGGLGTAQEAFCPALPPMMASMPHVYPFTTLDLRAVAAAQKIGMGLTGIQFNREVGLAFENWVLTTMGQLPRNTQSFLSPARQVANKANGGLPASVIPEYVAALSLVVDGTLVDIWPQSKFYEVKAVTGALVLSSSRSQILGLIDVLASSPVAVATEPYAPPPQLVFTTTGNTTISPTVFTYATQRGVAVWQQVVFSDFNPPGDPDLYLGPAVPLNPQVYGTATLPVLPSGWAPSKLTSPTTPPTNLLVPGDPDPPDVD